MKILRLLVSIVLLPMTSMATPIQIDDWPYVSSLGSSALRVERSIVDGAKKVCGSLDEVASITKVRLRFADTEVVKIRPNGQLGGDFSHSVLTFAYPRIIGRAEVTCKTSAK